MVSQQSQSPLDLLLKIEQRTRAAIEEQSRQGEEEWVGVLFQLRRDHLLVPMSQLSEVVTPPQVTRVPGVKPWLVGIANMRGNLLPITDLGGFLYGEGTAGDTSRRVLVGSCEGTHVGLLVDAVLGMKHFREQDETSTPPEISDQLLRYVTTSFGRDSEQFGVFSLATLLESADFMDAAI